MREYEEPSPFETWYEEAEEELAELWPEPDMLDRFLLSHEASLDWLSSTPPSFLLSDKVLEQASVNHFEHLNTVHPTEILNCSLDHLPQHMFPDYLGPVVQVLIQVLSIRKVNRKEKIGGLEINNPVLCALLHVLVNFENGRTFISKIDAAKGEVISVLAVDGLRLLAANEKDKEIVFCQLKDILHFKVVLGPPEDL